MAPPRRKARGRPRKERVIRPRYAHVERRKRPDIRRRAQSHEPINVQQLIYSLLNADEYNQVPRKNRAYHDGFSDDGFPGKRRKYREPSYDSSMLRDSSVTIDDSEYSKSAATSVGDLSMVMDAANSSAASSSGNSSVSNISIDPIVLAEKSIDNTRALLKKRSLVQVINNYIKAGIEEGKRQAKKYIRKALSFGVKSGYLIPTDPRGQIIRVSPTLIESKRADPEARKRRRKARRGEDNAFMYDSEHTRPLPPWKRSQKPYREPTPKPEIPPKKRRKISDTKEVVASHAVNNTKKKVVTRGRRGRRRKSVTEKNKTIIFNFSVSSDTSDEDQRKSRRRRSSQKRETAGKTEENKTRRRGKSPRTRREEKDNSRKKRQHSDDEDNSKINQDEEEDERISIGRRKSNTNRENYSRQNNEPNELPMRGHEEVLEVQNNNNVQNNNVDMI